jgi:hypothetical protein
MTEVVTLACLFCGKTQREVAKLIVGPPALGGTLDVAICDECVELCKTIVQEGGPFLPRSHERAVRERCLAQAGMLSEPWRDTLVAAHAYTAFVLDGRQADGAPGE